MYSQIQSQDNKTADLLAFARQKKLEWDAQRGYYESDSSPLREALRKHFAAFDGLTESQPIYKDKESEQPNGN